MVRRSCKFRSIAALLAIGQALLIAGPVAASNLDDGFLKGGAAARIRDELIKNNYKNVAILRFEVKKGKTAPTMNLGKLNSLVATRLENALIHVNDVEPPLGITRDAGATAAAKDPTAGWHSEASRAKLFLHDYMLAWGTKAVKVDAFLVGTVEISPDFREARILVKVFDKENQSLRPIGGAISIKTDRYMLREMSEGFVISKRAYNLLATKGAIPDSEVDNAIIEEMLAGKSDPIAKLKEYLDFQILADDAPIEIKDVEGRPTTTTLVPGQEVRIKVVAKEKLALLLRVNGVNTINKEGMERDRMDSSWWVLEPGKDYFIRGFYKDKEVFPFQVVAESEADKSELGANQDRHGIISFEIFKWSTGSTGEPRIVPRKTLNFVRVTGRGATLEALQSQLSGSLKVSPRPVYIVPGKGDSVSLETDSFQGVFIGGCDIYYRSK